VLELIHGLVLCCCILSGQPNFGAIEIDWNAVHPQIKVELRDLQGNPVVGVEFPISELKPSNVHLNKQQGHSFERHCSLETELPWLVRRRLALLFFGTIAGMVFTAISNISNQCLTFPCTAKHLSSCMY
jgi:alkaline phosphatase D